MHFRKRRRSKGTVIIILLPWYCCLVFLFCIRSSSAVESCSSTKKECPIVAAETKNGETTTSVCTSNSNSNHDKEDKQQQSSSLLELKIEQTTTTTATTNTVSSILGYMIQSIINYITTTSHYTTTRTTTILIHKNSWGEPQEIIKTTDRSTTTNYNYTKVYNLLVETQHYMQTQQQQQQRHEAVCQNRHRQCTYWATLGECHNNPQYMQQSCAPACQSCHLLRSRTCPTIKDPEVLQKTQNIWKQPGDLDDMFLQIVNNYHLLYHQSVVVVYSKPYYVDIQTVKETNQTIATKNEQAAATHKKKKTKIKDKQTQQQQQQYNQMGIPIIQDGPWIITLENFLTHQECDTLIELGTRQGYKRSTVIGSNDRRNDIRETEKKDRGEEVSVRTSTNAWCLNDCYTNTTTEQIRLKISNLTNIPDSHSEFFQLLKYTQGQFYQQHHDYNQNQMNRLEGVRILTMYLYLNDVKDSGGGTNFPYLNVTILPQKGKALLWPNVYNDHPEHKDIRTSHQALPVTGNGSIKYGANAWFHARDFKDAYARGCV